MRRIAISVALLLSGCAGFAGDRASSVSNSANPMKQNLACLGETVTEAFHGDFHDWVLPNFVPGAHLRAGQVSSCMAR